MFSPRLMLAVLLGTALPVTASVATTSSPASTSAEDATGLTFKTLVIGKRVYHDVEVRSRDTRSLFFRHREGLGSARLRDLPPEAQAALDYDPTTAPPESAPPPAASIRPSASTTTKAPAPRVTSTTSRLDQLFLSYDSAPEIRPLQSLQPEFIALNLAAKNQGRRPSCAIYAIVSALEFQNARLTGGLEKLSEEYLIWATRHSLGHTPASVPRDDAGEPLADAGYTLPSVISALQNYGIPLYDDMPNQPGLSADAVPPPDPDLIERARGRRLVFISGLPGASPRTRINSLVHALNAGFPVPAGLRWPHERSIHGGVLTVQRPLTGADHAVTFIGYSCPSGKLEDASFIFKNSYGPRWGQGGYGRASWRYLSEHLLDAYVLDVRAPDSSR